MNKVTIISHFSVPNWPVVNKLSMISKCLEVQRIHCSTLEKLREVISAPPSDRVLFFTDEGLIDEVQSLDAHAKSNGIEVAMFIHSPLTTVARRISDLSVVKYLIGGESFDQCGRDLSILIKKFADGDILDLDKYLAFGAKIHHKIITDSRSKKEAIEAVGAYISKLGDPGYLHPYGEYSRIVSQLTEEMLLNAVFDANPRLRGSDRSKPFQLTEAEQIEITWSYDGEYFGTAVRDPFGKITCDTIMDYVSSQRKMETIANSTSAGLGLKIIFEKAHQIIANVHREHVTEVIALVKFGPRLLDYERHKKSFFYFDDADSKHLKRAT